MPCVAHKNYHHLYIYIVGDNQVTSLEFSQRVKTVSKLRWLQPKGSSDHPSLVWTALDTVQFLSSFVNPPPLPTLNLTEHGSQDRDAQTLRHRLTQDAETTMPWCGNGTGSHLFPSWTVSCWAVAEKTHWKKKWKLGFWFFFRLGSLHTTWQ